MFQGFFICAGRSFVMSFNSEMDREYMLRAIELAKKGKGFTNPNPLVGAVIVKDGRIIGEGYHAKYGELHAERNAIASLKESAEGAVIYVTLEPCCHYGKTPPCTEAIIENKIAKVVIGSRDPNPKVAGKGVKALEAAGIEVVCDYMREECDRLNPVFFYYIQTGLPYVTLKYAMTADGKTATKTGASKWITGESAREYVQILRSENTGIMAGIGTVLADDPMLNVRIEGKRNPVRIICDSALRIPVESKLCKSAGEYPLVVAYTEADDDKLKKLTDMGVTLIKVNKDKDGRGVNLNELMTRLGQMKIDSILVEGGATLNESALKAGIVKEIKAFIAPKIFGGSALTAVEGCGVCEPGEAYSFKVNDVRMIGEDVLISMGGV